MPRRSPPDRILARAATEQLHPASQTLDKISIPSLVSLFVNEEVKVQRALNHQRPALTAAAELIFKKLSRGGRLIYVGAGTSGRLGILDASEIPPTFGMSPEIIQGVIAGGSSAVFKSQEGVEDDPDEGAKAIRLKQVTSKDVVCGIAASGRTPFVLGALTEAKKRKAGTIFLTCNPKRHPVQGIGVSINLPTGPEIVAGSTRLKAGTATKCALNLMSTIVMIRLGKVRGGRMIALQTTNEKLRVRAVRTVVALSGVTEAIAKKALISARWKVDRALEALKGKKGWRDLS